MRSVGADRRGANNIEYAVLIAALALGVYAAIALLGGNMGKSYNDFGTQAGAPGTNSLQRQLLGALGIPSTTSTQNKVNACNGASSRAGNAASGSGVSSSGFDEACANAMIQANYATPADFMSGFGIPIGASTAARTTACGAQGMTGAALGACVSSSNTAFQVMNGTLPSSAWNSGALGAGGSNQSANAFNNWVSSQPVN